MASGTGYKIQLSVGEKCHQMRYLQDSGSLKKSMKNPISRSYLENYLFVLFVTCKKKPIEPFGPIWEKGD